MPTTSAWRSASLCSAARPCSCLVQAQAQINLSRQLGPLKAVLAGSAWVIVLRPGLMELVVRQRGGRGELRNCRVSQVVNTMFLGAPLPLDGKGVVVCSLAGT